MCVAIIVCSVECFAFDCRFRGLQSFRHSPWDPKENLPLDYARIFQFENFSRTKKKVLNTEDDQGALVSLFNYFSVCEMLFTLKSVHH